MLKSSILRRVILAMIFAMLIFNLGRSFANSAYNVPGGVAKTTLCDRPSCGFGYSSGCRYGSGGYGYGYSYGSRTSALDWHRLSEWANTPLRTAAELKFLAAQPVRNLSQDREVIKYLRQHKVYVSLTTTAKRINKVHYTLSSLKSPLIDKIILTVPSAVKKLPTWLRLYPQVEILTVDPDPGPVAKILGAARLIQRQDPQAILISVDDDTGYPPGMVEEMVHHLVHAPRTAFSGSSQLLDFWGIEHGFHDDTAPSTQSHDNRVLEGIAAIGYRSGDLDLPLITMFSELDESCRMSDDLVISYALAYRGVARKQIHSSYFGIDKVRQFPFGFDGDALHRGKGILPSGQTVDGNINHHKYRRCFYTIKQFLKNHTSNPNT